MGTRSDRELGMHRAITRRDFLDGVSLAIAGSMLPPGLVSAAAAEELLRGGDYYPPALTGMRGSHDGSFEVAHALRDQKQWAELGDDTGEHYDLVVVGAGISGLAAAYFYRKAHGARARILLLDNHDDFGGHAKRNEFKHGDRLFIGYGGTQQIFPGPSAYGPDALGLIKEIGVDTDRFYTAFDQNLYKSLGLTTGVFFNAENFGVDKLVAGEGKIPWRDFLAQAPLSDVVRKDLLRLYEEKRDYLPGLSVEEKIALLNKISYNEFLLKYAKVHPDVIPVFQTRPQRGAIGSDWMTASGAPYMHLPGLQGLGIDLDAGPVSTTGEPKEIFHFPDGNASIARLLVRALIPAAVPGDDMEDVVTSRVNYGLLDTASSPVRIRLNSTAVNVKHTGDQNTAKSVDVTYVTGGKTHRVRGAHCVMACYQAMLPYLCPEMPEPQRRAAAYAVRSPIIYTNVLVSNWRAWQKLGVNDVYALNCLHSEVRLDFPVSLGTYKHSRSPDEPIVVHLEGSPLEPGLPQRQQFRIGRAKLQSTPFETFERDIRSQLGRMMGPGGFDPARDIEAITVNRWPHGYATGRDMLTDPDWPEAELPWVVARKPFGRISIANSDAGAEPLTQVAIDQALRAVRDLA